MTDLISRADAIEAVASITMSIHLSDVICDKLLALPSAEPKIIRVEYSPFSIKETSTPSQTSFRGTQEVHYYEVPSADAEESYLKAYYDGYNTASIEAQKVISDYGKVVRCKDCRYWTSYGNCTRWTDDTHDQAYTNANDFCSYGERREP